MDQYLTDEQKMTLSAASDVIKYKIPKYLGYPNDFDNSVPDLNNKDEALLFKKIKAPKL